MLQAITTKFLGPTNSRGSRVKATAQAGSVTINWDHGLNSQQNHCAAAQALAHKCGWEGRYVGGAMPDGGYTFVFPFSGPNAREGHDYFWA